MANRRRDDAAEVAFQEGIQRFRNNPLFSGMLRQMRAYPRGFGKSKKAWATVDRIGVIYVYSSRHGTPEEWEYVLAHCAMHLALGHFTPQRDPKVWQTACDIVVERFLRDLGIGRPPHPEIALPGGDELAVCRHLESVNASDNLWHRGLNDKDPDMLAPDGPKFFGRVSQYHVPNFPRLFANGLTLAMNQAIEGASYRSNSHLSQSVAAIEMRWFVTNYPLLGSMASAFELVEDLRQCQKLDVAIGSIDLHERKIYMNPAAGLNQLETRFVIAHELLHAGLNHGSRCQWRDPFLWNVACDFVINGWLVEMGVGAIPAHGLLYDPALKGMGAEEIYDLILDNRRKYAKESTYRGKGLGDIIGSDWSDDRVVDLDEFCRHCLANGLLQHQKECRGLLPAGLVEEITALSAPAIPWDVKLGQWLDGFFQPLEARRTYARPSRRQGSSPDIPRPRTVLDLHEQPDRTFGVVLDTSGSMSSEMLGLALGSIVSYALSRDVSRIRLVCCDAVAYDDGYVAAEEIAGRVKVKGRGGTVLQPGVDLLVRADDFPPDGPILVITDGYCDHVRVGREHAFLLPWGRSLPFAPRGPVFSMKTN